MEEKWKCLQGCNYEPQQKHKVKKRRTPEGKGQRRNGRLGKDKEKEGKMANT